MWQYSLIVTLFLWSGDLLEIFDVDAKLLGIVGMVTVVIFVLEQLFGGSLLPARLRRKD